MSSFFSAKRCFIFLNSIALLISCSVLARPLQIIHTNDLHSHFEHSGDLTRGSYARVKLVIDSLKQQAQNKGIETLVLDAGDFSEGSEFFLVDEGRASWQIMNLMGYDAVTIGNHDWVPGAKGIDEILKTVHPDFKLLGANFSYDKKYQNLKKTIRPYAKFSRADLRISVLGLSTDEAVYKWYVGDGTIDSPEKIAKKWMPSLRSQSDLIIALTHLGVDADVSLAKKVAGLDLIVGGHSHTALTQPIFVKNKMGASTPIVQAGEHGEFVGDLLVDVEPGKPLQILRYQLIPIEENIPTSPSIEKSVQEARLKLEKLLNPNWLYDSIGYSEISWDNPASNQTSIWGRFAADSIREAIGAEAGFDSSAFFGESLPQGPINRERIIQSYPRLFNPKKKTGWNIWKLNAPGWLLEWAISDGIKNGETFVASKLTYEVEFKNKTPNPKNFKINGRDLDPMRTYEIAVSEGIGRGAHSINVLLRSLLRPKDTGKSIWSALEQKLMRQGGVIKAPTHSFP